MYATGIDYEALANNWSRAKLARLEQTSSYNTNTNTNIDNSVFDNSYVSTQGNTSTDGVDDGKIGFWSAAKNIAEGAVKTAVNGFKGMFFDQKGFSIKRTLITMGMGALCAIPGVGIALGTLGAITGAVKVGSGTVKALNSKTDAEAKDNWENVGGGGFTLGLSLLGTKASVKAAKTMGNGAYNAAVANKTPFLGRVKALGSDILSSSKYSVINMANQVKSLFSFFKAKGANNKAMFDLKNAQRKQNVANNKNAGSGAEASSKPKLNMEQLEQNAVKASNDLANARAGFEQTSLGKVAKDFGSMTRKTWQGAKQLPNRFFEAVRSHKPVNLKFKMPSIPKMQIKNAISSLGQNAVKIYEKMTNSEASYNQLVNEFGYKNVLEVLTILETYGVLDDSI